ncbi:hypothetical protein Pcac1_g6451 [Phytophthora cactorum]|nr:hypothetical protein Pcac1_g6451 [Phytophthora cactorum]
MVPLKPRQRHTSWFQRIRSMFNHVRTALSSSPPSPFNEHEDSDDDDNFIARGRRFRESGSEELVVQEDDYELKQIWAKRQIEVLPLYLAQREGFEELTWEPAAHFSPKILRDFEQQYEDSVWDYQSARGRRRVLRRERPTRTSQRIRRKVL